ncbi:protein kilB [Streptomyces sp. NPDC059080]|uniref:protein kilB n=1 Tax=Streptomyces sp. NPDC059080 TaxID=3346718 RepID=UPI0036B82315
MFSSIVAVIGTLLGSITAYALQQRAARSERAEARASERRASQLTAVADLVAALADHRRAMWMCEDIALTSGTDTDAYREARAASHATRAALSTPLTTLRLLAPDLAGTADAAACASYALRNAADADTLAARRNAAVEAADRLAADAAAHLNR